MNCDNAKEKMGSTMSDYDALKEAVIKMHEHPLDRQECVEYSKKFSKEKMIHQYYELYISMAKK